MGMTRMCRITSLAMVLMLMLALTSVTMSSNRGQTRNAAGQIVLCTGTGPVSVQVDKNGQPIEPVHICPDCALAMFAALIDPASGFLPNAEPKLVYFESEKKNLDGRHLLRARVRGPPRLI